MIEIGSDQVWNCVTWCRRILVPQGLPVARTAGWTSGTGTLSAGLQVLQALSRREITGVAGPEDGRPRRLANTTGKGIVQFWTDAQPTSLVRCCLESVEKELCGDRRSACSSAGGAANPFDRATTVRTGVITMMTRLPSADLTPDLDKPRTDGFQTPNG